MQDNLPANTMANAPASVTKSGLEASTEQEIAWDKKQEEARRKARFRHRMIGATVFVATLLIVLPMFFAIPEIKTDKKAASTIPGIPKEPFGNAVQKLELAVNSADNSGAPEKRFPLKDLATPNVVDKNAPEVITQPRAAKSEKEVASGTDQAKESLNGGYFIQVLATSSEPGAMREMARYKAAGLPVYAVRVQKKSTTIWRVRLGPFETRSEAERVALKLDSQNITHMPVQFEKTSVNNAALEKKATEPAVKPVQKSAQKSTQKPSVKAETTVQKASQKKAQDKPVQPSKSEVSKTAKTGAKRSADPLADTLKSVREKDFIAEQLARERAKERK